MAGIISSSLLVFISTSWMSSYAMITSSACYSSGGDCSNHILQCPDGQTIFVLDMQFGFKSPIGQENEQCSHLINSCVEYMNHKERCCEYDENHDCLKNYSSPNISLHRQNCSDKQFCKFRAEHDFNICSKNWSVKTPIESTFSVVHYECRREPVSRPRPVGTVSTTEMLTTKVTTARSTSTRRRESRTTSSTSLTSSQAAGSTERESSQPADVYRDEGTLNLVVGASVGVGVGVICIVVIIAVCYIRRTKRPAPSSSSSSFPGRAAGPAMRSTSRSTSTTHTHTISSYMPSSYYSSFFHSDTLPSSHPDSPYSTPNNPSLTSSLGRASYYRNYGYHHSDEPAPLDNQSLGGSYHAELAGQRHGSLVTSSPLSESRKNLDMFSLFSFQIGERVGGRDDPVFSPRSHHSDSRGSRSEDGRSTPRLLVLPRERGRDHAPLVVLDSETSSQQRMVLVNAETTIRTPTDPGDLFLASRSPSEVSTPPRRDPDNWAVFDQVAQFAPPNQLPPLQSSPVYALSYRPQTGPTSTENAPAWAEEVSRNRQGNSFHVNSERNFQANFQGNLHGNQLNVNRNLQDDHNGHVQNNLNRNLQDDLNRNVHNNLNRNVQDYFLVNLQGNQRNLPEHPQGKSQLAKPSGSSRPSRSGRAVSRGSSRGSSDEVAQRRLVSQFQMGDDHDTGTSGPGSIDGASSASQGFEFEDKGLIL